MIPNYFERVREQTKVMGASAKALIIANKLIAGVATILILKATDMGDVAVVQALGGLQFVFILLLGMFFAYWGRALKSGECCDSHATFQKAVFVAVISVGFLMLFM
jgi:hypothetical protein